ncbi:MAG TPA: ATPase domain-containing protein [Vicinamibacterales bacterium]|nr:ATPase domain-containing protein [Vicinamibacterales bacterium]
MSDAVGGDAGKTNAEIVPTGIPGLDDVLGGGLQRRRLYLIEGVPGAGKTTLALQFLLTAARRGESVIYVTLSETLEELQAVASSHGWMLDHLIVHQMTPNEGVLDPDEQSTMFHPSEIELAQTTRAILADVDRHNPSCVVLDSLSELRLLSGNALRYRRQILALKQYFAARGCIVMLLDDLTATEPDGQVQSIVHAVVRLEQLNPEYGSDRRRLRVVKYRAQEFRGGYHDYVIRRGGLQVFPRLVAAEHRQVLSRSKLASEIAELDDLLGGGLEQGTSTLFVGAAGTGKSTLAAQFAAAAAGRGQRTAFFVFDESPATLLTRAEQLGIPLAKGVQDDRVMIRPVDPAEFSPGEFVELIRKAVERDGVELLVIDSLNGYLNAMPGERFLSIQLHELLAYLSQRNVATILVSAHHGLLGTQMTAPVDATYLADAVVLMRFFEARGEIRQALSVVKKRGGSHERTIREFGLENGAIRVGQALTAFRGVLTGVPVYEGPNEPLIKQ